MAVYGSWWIVFGRVAPAPGPAGVPGAPAAVPAVPASGFFPFSDRVLPSSVDVDLAYKLLKELGDTRFPMVSYRLLDTPDSEIDDVHHEIAEHDKEWKDPVRLRAYIAPEKETKPMTKFGVESMRNISMYASVPHLLEAGLATQNPDTYEVTLLAGAGDRFEHSANFIYDVLKVVIGATFADTDIPLYYEFTAERKRLESDYYAF